MLLYSLIVLWFTQDGQAQVQFHYRPWYRQKRQFSFADMLRTLRRLGLEKRLSGPPDRGVAEKKAVKELFSLATWLP